MKKVFSARLHSLCKNRSVAECARIWGIQQATLDRYIKAQRTPNGDSIVLICRATGVSADWLLGLSPGAASPAPIPASSPAAPPAAPSASTLLALIASQQETIRDQAASLRILAAPKKTCAAPAGGATATKPA